MIKRHLVSAGITFVATFFLVVGFELSSPDFVFTKVALQTVAVSALVAGTRALAKVIYECSLELLSKKK